MDDFSKPAWPWRFARLNSISAGVEENTAATEEMAAQADAVDAAIKAIAAVSDSQSNAIQDITAGAEEMTAQIQQIGADAQEMADVAGSLRERVARFQLTTSEPTPLREHKGPAKAA